MAGKGEGKHEVMQHVFVHSEKQTIARSFIDLDVHFSFLQTLHMLLNLGVIWLCHLHLRTHEHHDACSGEFGSDNTKIVIQSVMVTQSDQSSGIRL